MVKPVDKVYEDAMQLERHDRVTLVQNLLRGIEDDHDAEDDDTEILERIKALEEGRMPTSTYEEVKARLEKRFGR